MSVHGLRPAVVVSSGMGYYYPPRFPMLPAVKPGVTVHFPNIQWRTAVLYWYSDKTSHSYWSVSAPSGFWLTQRSRPWGGISHQENVLGLVPHGCGARGVVTRQPQVPDLGHAIALAQQKGGTAASGRLLPHWVLCRTGYRPPGEGADRSQIWVLVREQAVKAPGILWRLGVDDAVYICGWRPQFPFQAFCSCNRSSACSWHGGNRHRPK